MEPGVNQFADVISLDQKRKEKNADKSPFGPIKSGIIKPTEVPKPDVDVDEQ